MAAMSSQRKVIVAVMWVVSLVVAFLIGTQFSLTPANQAVAPAQTPAPAAPAASEPAAQPATTPDAAAAAELEAYLLDLPRRQADDPLALGNVDAKVVLTNWSDYRCPFCAKWHEETFPQLQRYIDDGTLRVEFRDLVIFGQESMDTAVAARAAGAQGKFWEYQEAVFSHAPASGHPTIDRAQILAFAQEAGVPDQAAFEAALADPAHLAAAQSDTMEAQQMGISGTPFFVIGGQAINGAQPIEAFTAAIEAEAAR